MSQGTRNECKIVHAWTGWESAIYFSEDSARQKIRETDGVSNKSFKSKELLLIVPEHAIFEFNDQLGVTGKSPSGKYWTLDGKVFTI